LSHTVFEDTLIAAPVILVMTVSDTVIAVWFHDLLESDRFTRQQAVPQRKPGENAISASFASIRASRISWSKEPIEIGRGGREAFRSPRAFSESLPVYGARCVANQPRHLGIGGPGGSRTPAAAGNDASRSGHPGSRDREPRGIFRSSLPSSTSVLPLAFDTHHRRGHPVVGVAPRMTSIPATRRASLRSTSMPVVREQRHDLGAFAPGFVHGALPGAAPRCRTSSGDETARMGDRRVRERLADHGRPNAPRLRIVYALNTASPKSLVSTFCARNSILPAKSLSTTSLTRAAP